MWGEPRYAAYALDASGTVTWADLGPAAPLDRQVAELRTAVVQRDPVETLARAVYAATLGALDLKDAAHLVLATDGPLSLVPFNAVVALGAPDGAERTPTVSYVGSGRELMSLADRPPVPATKPLVVYDVD